MKKCPTLSKRNSTVYASMYVMQCNKKSSMTRIIADTIKPWQGAIPEIESFEEEELMNARLLVEQEAEECNVRYYYFKC